MGKKNVNDRGIYDDGIFVISPDTFTSFNGNTDPSVRYKTGRAMLRAPQRVVYKPGYHGYGRRSGHPAFRQENDVVVRRDGGVGNGLPSETVISRIPANQDFGSTCTAEVALLPPLPDVKPSPQISGLHSTLWFGYN